MEPEPGNVAHQHDEVGEHAAHGAPAKKRARKAHTQADKRRGRKMSLSRLTEMPLDVVFEIFSHLHPGDLLNVARSAKIFRELLMKRSSVTIWKAARGNMEGLPDCPDAVSEPAYANLLFTSNCTFCGKTGIQNIEWTMFVRCCKTCREDTTLFLDMSGHDEDPWLQKHVPSIVRGKNIYVRVAEMKAFIQKIQEYERGGKDDNKVFVDQTLEYLKFFDQVLPCKKWYIVRAYNRERELDAIREQRRIAVWAKLAELGLGDEEPLMSDSERERLERKEGMKEPTPLTERGWEKVKDPIIDFVRHSRKERICKERYAPYTVVINAFIPHLNAFARTRPLDEAFPSILEFCMLPQVRTTIVDLIRSGVNTLDVDHFTELVPEVCDEWREGICGRLVELLPPWLRRDEIDGLAALESALVWFDCGSHHDVHGYHCRDTTIAYPRILNHPHLYTHHRTRWEPKDPDDDLINAVHEKFVLKPTVFSPEAFEKDISFDLHASFVACEIVTLCGLDPATALAVDMDRLDARIACVPCKRVMTWRKAVSHVFKDYHKVNREWVLLNDTDTKSLRKIEAKNKPKTTTGEFHCYRCRRFDECRHWLWGCKGLKALKAHLDTQHNIVQFRPKQGVDYYHAEGEPTSDLERPHEVKHKDLDFDVSTPTLIAAGW